VSDAVITSRGLIDVKGKGLTPAYFLVGPLDEPPTE
jgi:hypothetical protein